jgi:hypothetical protein
MKHLENYTDFNGYYVEPLVNKQIGVMTFDKDDYGVFLKSDDEKVDGYCYFKGDKNSADNYARVKNKEFKKVKSSDRFNQTSTSLVDPIIYQVGNVSNSQI